MHCPLSPPRFLRFRIWWWSRLQLLLPFHPFPLLPPLLLPQHRLLHIILLLRNKPISTPPPPSPSLLLHNLLRPSPFPQPNRPLLFQIAYPSLQSRQLGPPSSLWFPVCSGNEFGSADYGTKIVAYALEAGDGDVRGGVGEEVGCGGGVDVVGGLEEGVSAGVGAGEVEGTEEVEVGV